ncbi:archaea-specific SMC-related protein [Natrialbaceae archaeon GCM10025810]|uniref:archaea-specific SMC-related protein n=1 Tax=Halovalidus salilacus TaxID=3075124 RepID=UPI003622E3C6
MAMELLEEKEVTLDVENIGGIDETSVELSPGVTVLSGRNATNRTSLLQAIMAALGSENVTVKADADEAHVKLTTGDETYTRTLTKSNGTIRTSGDPYLENPIVADLFAFLLESNEIRRAVTTNSDLRELIMRPVDTDKIEAEIDRLIEQRREVASELEELESLKKRLPTLEEKRTDLYSQIESKRDKLEETESKLDNFDADVEETRSEQSEVEEKLYELRNKRNSLEDIRYRIETEKESLSSLRNEQTELEDEVEALPDAPAGRINELNEKIRQLRERKQQLESEISEVQNVIRFNEEMLEGSASELLDQFGDENQDVTDQLLPDDTVTCWTCNSDVQAKQIETTIDNLRELTQEKFADVNDLESRISDLREQKSELEQHQREREQIEHRLSKIETEIEETEATIEEFTDRRDTLHDEVSDLENEIEEMEDESYEEILTIHREANQLEYDLGTLENEVEQVEEEIETIESQLRTEDDLKEQKNRIKAEIDDLRMTVERIETQAIDEFNEHMDTVLDLLDYRNLERIWLERSETDVREGRRKVTKSVFDLHVIRKTESGTAYEDTVDHLSESEREVTGLILGLAGYLAHEVYKTVPFLLLDSLEAIDSERIATLVDYLNEFSPSLVVALLEEDAAALDDDYHYVTSI